MYLIMVSFYAVPEKERGEKSKNSGNVTLRRKTRGASRRRQEEVSQVLLTVWL